MLGLASPLYMLLGPTSFVLLATAGAARKEDEDHAKEQKQASHYRHPDACDFNARTVLVLISDSDADSLILDISMRSNQEEKLGPGKGRGVEAIKSEKEKMEIRKVGK